MERLSAQDLMMIWPEDRGWAQDIGALAILDGATLLDGDGRFSIELAREHVRRRHISFLASASACTSPGSVSAGRYGWTGRWSTLPSTFERFRFLLRPINHSFCSHVRICAADV